MRIYILATTDGDSGYYIYSAHSTRAKAEAAKAKMSAGNRAYATILPVDVDRKTA